MEKVGNTGLLLQTEIPDPENQNENEVLSQFVHLSIQEFLAMVALLNREPTYASQVLTELFETDHFNMARLFVCGLAFSKDSNVVRKMVTAVGGTFQLNNEIIASLENVVQVCYHKWSSRDHIPLTHPFILMFHVCLLSLKSPLLIPHKQSD